MRHLRGAATPEVAAAGAGWYKDDPFDGRKPVVG